MEHHKEIYYIMGVSGSGKSTLGKTLAEELGVSFYDGDDFHPLENIDKMKSGRALNDRDRAGWLSRLNALAREHLEKGAVIACSALKESYREQLRKGLEGQETWVFLSGSLKDIQKRMEDRKGHFMPVSLLQSQFDTLEPPSYGIHIPLSLSVDQAVNQILNESSTEK